LIGISDKDARKIIGDATPITETIKTIKILNRVNQIMLIDDKKSNNKESDKNN